MNIHIPAAPTWGDWIAALLPGSTLSVMVALAAFVGWMDTRPLLLALMTLGWGWCCMLSAHAILMERKRFYEHRLAVLTWAQERDRIAFRMMMRSDSIWGEVNQADRECFQAISDAIRKSAPRSKHRYWGSTMGGFDAMLRKIAHEHQRAGREGR